MIRDFLLGQLRRFHPVGLALGLIFAVWSMTPSLLPRTWLLQSVATGLSFVSGYVIGVVAAWLVRRCGISPSWSERTRRTGWWVLAAVAAIAIPAFLVLGSWWQEVVRDLVGAPQPGRSRYLLVLLVAALVVAILVGFARLVRGASNRLTRYGSRYVPGPIARTASVALLLVLALFLIDGAPYRALVGNIDESFALADNGTADDVEPPTQPERSGSPESAEPFDSLGKEGRTFVASGPDAAEIEETIGRPAIEPIRAYAGREAADSFDGIAARVVAELDRTDAWSRDVLAVATTTGRGWINENLAQALEYTTAGDSAIASMQYSYLPSPLAFLADRDSPPEAGRALFEAVYSRWDAMPEDARPRLYVFGESLGSFGGQAAFSGEQDMLARVDGGIWTGTPHFTPQWQRITDDRDPGSPQRLPVIDDGEAVRFAASPSDLDLGTPWGEQRIVYWQHASDPIVWWSPDLILRRPDWLREPLGPDVDPGIRWLPAVTFWQVTLDMVFSADVPDGHGHAYGSDAADLWAAILQQLDWTADDVATVRSALEE
ncbi:alpha/beta hydrolase [Rhodococcus rhodnii]|nr:alpha/beta-hydrolase family protein [Rhodococcus rhodnii]